MSKYNLINISKIEIGGGIAEDILLGAMLDKVFKSLHEMGW